MRPHRILGVLPLGLLLLQGCGQDELTDEDGDGYLATVDCDESDASVHPGAEEVGDDAIDNDCDGVLDCEDDDVARTFAGDVGEAEVGTLCAEGCPIDVDGSVVLDASALTDLDGLSCVVGISGDLAVRQNPSLTSISGLASLTTVGGNVSIGEYWCEWTDSWECTGTGNPALVSYDGLQNLESIGGWLWLADSDLMVNPGMSFDRLATVGGNSGMGVLFDGHAAITEMPGFPLLTVLPGYNEVWGNDALAGLSGLGAVQWVDSLSLVANPGFEATLGLNSLQEVAGTLVFASNGNTSLLGLDALVAVGSALEFWDSLALLSFEGLGSLESVGGWLTIINNDGIVDLSGLDSLSTIGLDLNLMDNEQLESVDGLESLTTINRNLQIMGYVEGGNPSLVDLDGLYGLEKVSGDVIITGNTSLTDAEAQALVDEIEHICGTVTLTDNGG